MYIYPDNLKSKAVLWLWELRDIAIIGVGALISVFAMAQLGFLPPVVITAAYAFLSIRLEDTSILDFLRYAIRYFLHLYSRTTGSMPATPAHILWRPQCQPVTVRVGTMSRWSQNRTRYSVSPEMPLTGSL